MINLEYKDRVRNLDNKASGVVKSNKFFPVFLIDGKEYIFKPLSKTKPLTTPLFAYAECFWSEYLGHLRPMPKYQLAICRGYSEAEPKYFDYGTLVENIVSKEENLVNLYEYFEENNDPAVDIHGYVNYCMKTYDFRDFFNTKLLLEDKKLSEEIAMQILMSIVSADENYHYENVLLLKKYNSYRLAPMLDHEFSQMFLYGDNREKAARYYEVWEEDLRSGTHKKNIEKIALLFPNIIKEMITFLESQNLPELNFDPLFDFPCSSDAYAIGKAIYKENNLEKAKIFKMLISLVNLDYKQLKESIMETIKENISVVLDVLKK